MLSAVDLDEISLVTPEVPSVLALGGHCVPRASRRDLREAIAEVVFGDALLEQLLGDLLNRSVQSVLTLASDLCDPNRRAHGRVDRSLRLISRKG